MLPTNGDSGNRIYYKSKNKWAVDCASTEVAEFGENTTTVRNNLEVSGDINAAGGLVQSLTFFRNGVLQATSVEMTSSIISASAGPVATNWFKVYTQVPMVRSGSVIGFSIYTPDDVVKSGSLTASIAINGASSALTLGMHTGTAKWTTAAKGTYTFNPGDRISVFLTASTAYLTNTTASASFVANVLVEQ